MLRERPLITPHEVVAEAERLMNLLNTANDELCQATREYAIVALHYAYAKEEVTAENAAAGPTALGRIVDARTAVAKAKRQIADYSRSDAMTNVLNVRAQLSACQTMARMVTSELEMAG